MPPLFPSYDDEKIRFYYPDHLRLKLVQVIHRHGERTPVKPYLEHVIPSLWNLCHETKELQSNILLFQEDKDNQDNFKGYEQFTYRRIDTYSSPSPGTCAFGQLTDIGRKSMSELGAHFRTLYVDKLKFLDEKLSNDKLLFLRSTDHARTFESLQQLVIGGLYPSKFRSNSYVLNIHTRDLNKETLHQNSKCKRLMKLIKQFEEASKLRYESDLKYLTTQLKPIVKEVKLDSEPSLNQIFDTVTAAKANKIPIPKEFTEEIIDKIDEISTGEWFNGNEKTSNGGHDSTMAPLIATFSAFDHRWPKFNSHLTLELFESKEEKSLFSSAQDKHYVRVKYNDKILELPACQNDDKHHPNDKSLCTLRAFLTLVDSHIPKDYIQECSDV
ncbi:phosphoglycerate mutase-like protein [Rhizophagus clarus]|uniref:Phosphoglycerate mutase-like protein n=1 Tax=Rhizophagus clarus TaxID=94130 RepID=A0A8H3R4N5_9GLOM|nr:phosphoglycerate mutase-like protein [Rhizophagus clarus]